MGNKIVEPFGDVDSDDEPDLEIHDEGLNLGSSIPKGITNVSLTCMGQKKYLEGSAEKQKDQPPSGQEELKTAATEP